jgi:hypothetical protein
MWFGYGREELWFNKAEGRRYETTYVIWRKFAMWFIPIFYIFPQGLWVDMLHVHYGPYGNQNGVERKLPFDNMYIESGGYSTDPEWIRHIHSTESY